MCKCKTVKFVLVMRLLHTITCHADLVEYVENRNSVLYAMLALRLSVGIYAKYAPLECAIDVWPKASLSKVTP